MSQLTFKKCVTISRPRFWVYSLGPFLIGIIAVVASGMSLREVWVPLLVFGIYFLTFGNLYIYGINDIFDYETDLKNPKKTGYEMLVTPNMWQPLGRAIFLTTAPFFIYAATLGWEVVIAFAAFLFFAGQYSAPVIRAKARPIFDSLFSAGHYVAGGVMGFVMSGGDITAAWLGIAAGILWAMAMHAYSAVPDIQADADAGLSTVAILLGKQGTIIACLLAYVVAGVIGAIIVHPLLLILLVPYIFIMLKSLGRQDVFRLYKLFPWLNLISGFLVFWAVYFFW